MNNYNRTAQRQLKVLEACDNASQKVRQKETLVALAKKMPDGYWRGYVSNRLKSIDGTTFVLWTLPVFEAGKQDNHGVRLNRQDAMTDAVREIQYYL